MVVGGWSGGASDLPGLPASVLLVALSALVSMLVPAQVLAQVLVQVPGPSCHRGSWR